MKSISFIVFAIIAVVMTFPLVLHMNSSVYGPYDHATTDIFAVIHMYFWWIPHAPNPLYTSLFHAPEGERMIFANMTGFAMAPVSALFGHVFSYNLVILLNLILSAFGMYLLVTHITKSRYAGFISGIAFGFCTNMLVRAYTTFDTIQIQWIPLFVLYMIKYYQFPSWRNAILAGVFLLCNVLFTMPYYLVWLPVLTVILCAVLVGKKPPHWWWWLRMVSVFMVVYAVFVLYFHFIVGGQTTYAGAKPWGTADLAALSLKPADYLVPHPKSLLFKEAFKESYWDAVPRPERNSDSNVAYIGYVAAILAIFGAIKTRGRIKWVFMLGAAVAFWSTLTPYSPSGLILVIAPFARRILLYKAYVQFGIAGLAGMGMAHILQKQRHKGLITSFVAMLMLVEYSIVPPALSVDLTQVPEVYRVVKSLPEGSILLELPQCRLNGNMYQGYCWYQTYHHKALYNSRYGVREINGLEELKRAGVTHIVYHYFTGTQTVQFRGAPTPAFEHGEVPGIKRIYIGPRELITVPQSPYDYQWADLYEIQ